MTRFTALAAIALTAGCDAFVGGLCLPGYAEDGEHCVPVTHAGDGAGGDAFDPVGGSAGENSGGTSVGGAPSCQPPLTWCAEGCVDLQTDIDNCGACGLHCATELCVDGVCQGEPVGHLVTIGMSYQESHVSSRRVLGNAVFRTLHEPTRIIEYRQHAMQATIAQVHAIVHAEAEARNRTYELTAVNHRQLADILDGNAFDVLLVHDQANAPAGFLFKAGTDLANVVSAFAQDGGTVVVTASGAGTGEMCDFLTATGILACSGFGEAMTSLIHNQLPNDVVGNGVLGPFVAKPLTSTLLVSETNVAQVFATDEGNPVVVHKVSY